MPEQALCLSRIRLSCSHTGPQKFGHLESNLAIIFFFTLLVDCGLTPYGAREIAKDNDAVAHLAVHVMLVRGVLAVGAFTLLVILVTVIESHGR